MPIRMGCSQLPPDSSKRSRPSSFSHSTTWPLSALVKPPFWKSDEFSLIETGKSLPTAARTRRTTSSSSRARFSSEPPQASVRWLTSGLRNCDSR